MLVDASTGSRVNTTWHLVRVVGSITMLLQYPQCSANLLPRITDGTTALERDSQGTECCSMDNGTSSMSIVWAMTIDHDIDGEVIAALMRARVGIPLWLNERMSHLSKRINNDD